MCEAWARNIEKLNAPFQLAAARNPGTCNGYDGDRFLFCPWCGNPLVDSGIGAKDCLPTNELRVTADGDSEHG